MLLRRAMPRPFMEWNGRWAAPFGKRGKPGSDPADGNDFFAMQPNNTSRAWEYPWVFHALSLEPGQRVLEVGGGLSGLQFVLARAGAKVVNVDPGMHAAGIGFACEPSKFARLNSFFQTSVELTPKSIGDADLPPASFDRAFSISVIEHLAPDEVTDALARIHAALKPGGLFILTWDLFLDCHPFTTRESNRYGRNYPLFPELTKAGFEVVEGNPSELYGSETFSTDRIQSNLAEYVLGSYPAMVQATVLRRPLPSRGA